jgi:uncharacterized protein YbjT (DUF2867 family)
MTTPTRFTDIAAFLADETTAPAERFARVFTETADQVRRARTDDAITADMPDPLQMQRGVEMLLVISSNEIGQRAVQHKNVIGAAKRAGVKRTVYTSAPSAS